MATESTHTTVLYDVPWETYVGLTDAVPEQLHGHTYADDTLELSSNLLYDVSWESYEQILEAFGDRRFPHTYADGVLEIMSPTEEHDWVKGFIGRLIEMAAFELNVPIKTVGSTTRKRKEQLRGLEPDESYYVQHEADVRMNRNPDQTKVPPPDLVVEVDMRRPEVDRFEVYSRLGVPEIWQYRKKQAHFWLLSDGAYAESPASLAFPLIDSQTVTLLVAQIDSRDVNSIIRDFVKWLSDQQQAQ